MSLFTILSIDGEGIRGIIPAMVLTKMERRTGRRTAELFDLIAGTSTGGVLALGLTVADEQSETGPKFEASQLVSFYEEDGKESFRRVLARRRLPPWANGGKVSLGAD